MLGVTNIYAIFLAYIKEKLASLITLTRSIVWTASRKHTSHGNYLADQNKHLLYLSTPLRTSNIFLSRSVRENYRILANKINDRDNETWIRKEETARIFKSTRPPSLRKTNLSSLFKNLFFFSDRETKRSRRRRRRRRRALDYFCGQVYGIWESTIRTKSVNWQRAGNDVRRSKAYIVSLIGMVARFRAAQLIDKIDQ